MTQEPLASHPGFMTAVLDALPAQTAVVDGQGTIVAVNVAWSRFMTERGGQPRRCAQGVNVFEVLSRVRGRDRASAHEAAEGLRAVLRGETAEFDRDITCVLRQDDPLFFSLQMVPLDTEGGGAVLCYTDITARKRLELEAERRAVHDDLTGLPNRVLLLDRLQQAMGSRDASRAAVLFIDLDQFKLVNDGYGHAAGDQVLQQLARRLLAVVRPSDTVARLAGDEFVILCERLPFLTEAYRLAQRVLATVTEPFSVDGARLSLGASIGIATAEDHPTARAEDLLRAADQAMFEAKARGRNQFAVHDSGVQSRSQARVEQSLQLRRLATSDRLGVHYQPLVDLRDGHITGVEALLRWKTDGDPVDTAASVALAEQIGVISEIGRRVLREACEQGATFLRSDGSVLPLSVNLAPQQLDRFLVATVREVAESTGFPLSALTLELTERSVMSDPAASIAVLSELRDLGVLIAIDDFGVGYSSLASLRDLPLDTLKIDRDFVRALATPSADDRIIRAVIQLADALELHVVAEGIELDEQRTRLIDLGCNHGQGFLFSSARPAAEIRRLVQR